MGALSLDPRSIGNITPAKEGAVPPVHAVAVTSDGYSLRFGLDGLVEPSTRAGRRYARPADGAEVVGVSAITGSEVMIAATRAARAMLCPVEEINFLSGPGRGVILIKLQPDDDAVLGFVASTGDRDLLDRRNEPWRGADDQHREIRSDRPRRQGTRASPARPLRAGRSDRAGAATAIARGARVAQVTRVSRVSRVAQVARVARVAQVARVALRFRANARRSVIAIHFVT